MSARSRKYKLVAVQNGKGEIKQGLRPIDYANAITDTEEDAIELVRLISRVKDIGFHYDSFGEIFKLKYRK